MDFLSAIAKYSDSIYLDVLLVSWIELLILAFLLLSNFRSWSPDDTSRRILLSRRELGFAFLGLAVQVFVQWAFDVRRANPDFATALNLTCYYFLGVLISQAYISLLDRNFCLSNPITPPLIKWAVLVVAMWSAVILDAFGVAMPLLKNLVLITVAVFFFFDVGRWGSTFFVAFCECSALAKDSGNVNLQKFLRATFRSSINVISIAFLGSVLAFAPRWVQTPLMLYGALTFFLLFRRFMATARDAEF